LKAARINVCDDARDAVVNLWGLLGAVRNAPFVALQSDAENSYASRD